MRKFKTPKVKIKSSTVIDIFKYLFLILLTSLILVDILIALPLTERISNLAAYDLETKSDKYWAKEYVLETESTEESEVNRVKNILDKRLASLGVEKKTVTSEIQEEKSIVRVAVQTTQTQQYVDELVRSPFILNVVTRKSDVDFEDEENPYAIYLGENYDSTEFTRDTFRNIYITQLKNSANEYSYFGLFKVWPWETEWNTFLVDNAGQVVGVSVDGFVTPVQIPFDDPSNFAVPISSTEKNEAHLVSILYNSGSMPTDYTQTEQRELPIELIESDYIKITEAILLAVILIYAYLLLIDKTPKKTLLLSGLSTVLTLATWIAYLKIAAIPVDISILAIEVLVVVTILRITTENKESHILVNALLALILSIAMILGTGYVKIFAIDMFTLLMIGILSQILSSFYINQVKGVLKV